MTAALETIALGGRYQIGERLGAGGMGVVYRALDRLTGQAVALKRVSAQCNQPRMGLDKRLALAQEFQTLASVRHPNIITVLDYGFDAEQQPFFAMELLEKPQNILAFGARQSQEVRVGLLVQMLQALAYLHRRGILHRDIKPGNVLVVDGQVKVLDFGLSTVQPKSDLVMGTPAYMAPELLLGEPASEATDLYAVGVMAYELLIGRHPFDTRDLQKLMSDILSAQPDLTDLNNVAQDTLIFTTNLDATVAADADNAPDIEAMMSHAIEPMIAKDSGLISSEAGASAKPSLAKIVQRLLAKSPKVRYSDASAVIRDLNAAVGEPLPLESEAIRESFLQAARFVGREGELGKLVEAMRHALAGQGSLWLVSGESGVGKSRLLDELRIHALVEGALVLRGQAVGLGVPYQMWREPLCRLILATPINDTDAGVLKSIIPEVDQLLGRSITPAPELEPEPAQKRLLAVIMSLFHRQSQPFVVILEDLQAARSESLHLLEQLYQSIANLPLLIVGSYRDDERFELPPTLADAQRLKLNRLDAEHITQLSESMLGAAGLKPQVTELLQRETEGNVFFVIEVVRALAEEAGQLERIGAMTLPAGVFTGGVQRIIQRRLDRVPSVYYAVLELAAVLGRQLDLTLLRSVFPNLEASLLACADAAVLEVQDDTWRFSHDKLREGVLMGLGAEARVMLHGRAACAIETVYPNSVDRAPVLAYHWHMAGNTAKEAHYAKLAGDQAYRVSAYREAAEYYERALSLTTENLADDAQARHLEAIIGLAKTRTRLSQFETAQQLLEKAHEQAAASGNRSASAEILAEMGRAALYQARYADAAQKLKEGLALSREVDNSYGVASTLATMGRVAFEQGNYAEAIQNYRESLDVSRASGNVWETAYALGGLGVVAASQGALDEARQHMEEALALYKQLGNREGVAGLSLNLSYAMLGQGHFAEAIQRAAESLKVSREIGEQKVIANSLNNMGYIAFVQGAYTEAKSYLEESLQSQQMINDQWSIANTLTNLGHVGNGLGNTAEAKSRFLEALRKAQTIGAEPLILEILAGIAKVHLAEGDSQKALDLIALVLEHPHHNADHQALAEPILADLRHQLSEEAVKTALEKSSTKDLQKAVVELLSE